MTKDTIDKSDSAVARAHWDADAQRYAAEHSDYLTEFYWSPERLHERDAQLLGDVSGQVVVEIGAGTAPCSRWLAAQFPTTTVIATDISSAMLRQGTARGVVNTEGGHNSTGAQLHLLQADVMAMPIADGTADTVFSSFGAFAFVEDLASALRESARMLKSGGRLVIAANNPFAWVFLDDPGPEGLTACVSYWQREYRETEEENSTGQTTYVEYHHTFGDWVRAFAATGLTLEDVIEPEWTEGAPVWGQWSPLRGAIFPSTQIFVATKQS